MQPYPIGTSGVAWGDAEIALWRSRQRRQRSYQALVLEAVDRLRDRYDVIRYGALPYAPQDYPLVALRSRRWRGDRAAALVTGGVHGYETSGVLGALRFAAERAAAYEDHFDLLIAPCVSPWGFEHSHRWNPQAVDPNRSFRPDSPAPEARALMQLVQPFASRVLVHVDLHETTDTDESEFRPALAARDGLPFIPGSIPDGFYVVDDTEHPQPAFQQAIIDAVSKVTHIAPADAKGEIIGSPAVAPGVIRYALKSLGLCTSVTGAPYQTTTEVYPDSPRATPEQCTAAQVVAACAALDYVLAQRAAAGSGT